MGFGAEVAAVLQYQAFDWLDAPIERVGAKFAPLAFAPVMEQFVVPQRRGRARRDQAHGGEVAVASEVKLPRLGQGMEAGTIAKWLKSRGRHGREGRAALRDRHRQGDAGGRGRLRRRAAEDRARRGRGAGRPDDRRTSARRARRSLRDAPTTAARRESAEKPAEAHERDPEREEGREAAAAAARRERERRLDGAAPRTAAASRPRRSRAGSRASAASSSRRCSGTGPDGRIVAEDVERGEAAAPAAAPRGRRRRARSSRSR